MKHHGNYILPTPEELALDIQCGKCANEYVATQIQRLRKKHLNTKRHREKRKKYNLWPSDWPLQKSDEKLKEK